jgi:energy-coupling factor transport system ATP-binding protein
LTNVHIKDLSLSYPSYVTEERLPRTQNNYILNDINLEIPSGEFLVISGNTGVGKTSLLSCINGVATNYNNAQIKGEIRIDGKNIDGWTIARRSKIVGTLMQNIEAQIFNVYAEDEIAFGCENLALEPETIRERVKKYSDLLNISPSSEISKLSLGQKQKTILASILAMEQNVLLLDEPLANLDKNAAIFLLTYLKNLTQHENKIVIVVEHRIDLTIPYLDRLVWLENGKITETLNQEELKQKYKHLHVKYKQTRNKQSGEKLFELNECSLGYNRIILQDLNFSIHEGEKIVILGENGSGKTTLLKSLIGLLKPKGGYLWRHSKLKKDPFRKMGLVYQNPNYQLFNDSVYEEFKSQKIDEQRINRYLQLFGLSQLKNRHPFLLSEGQKRILTIALMASMKPLVLLLDEPTVGQDYKSLSNIMQSLEYLNQEFHMCVIAVTHDIRFARQFGEKILWLKDGHLLKKGDSRLVQEYFKKRF